MTIKVLALASGVTGLNDHRVLTGALIQTTGQLQVRGGVTPSGGGGLSTVSAMVCAIAPVKFVIANTVASALGPYVVVSDASVNITFADGEASVSRIDRIIGRVYDNANDGSGDTKGDIYYLKGQASGAATALPSNSLLLYEVTVPAGTSAGSGGINFNTATADKRSYTAASGGLIPVLNSTDMSNLGASAYKGMVIYRNDLNALYGFDSSVFRPIGQITAANAAGLSSLDNPGSGLIGVARDTGYIYVFDGSSWILRAGNTVTLNNQITSDAATVSTTTLSTVVSVTLPRTGTYSFDFFGPFSNTTATGRIAFGLGGTSTPTAWRYASGVAPYNSATGLQGGIGSGTSYVGATSGAQLINSDLANSSGFCFCTIKGTVTVSAAGTLTFRFSNVSGTNTIGFKAGTLVNVNLIA